MLKHTQQSNARTYAVAVGLFVGFFLLVSFMLDGGGERGADVRPTRMLWTTAPASQESAAEKDLCDTRQNDELCYSDPNVWAVTLPLLSNCLLKQAVLAIDGERTECGDELTDQDPPVLAVDQSHCYPTEYFQFVKSAEYLKEPFDVHLRPHSTDLKVLKQFYCQDHFLYVASLAAYIPRDRPVTVVDAGANIGLASLLHAQVINFNGEVLAIEANPLTLEVLQSNTERLGDVMTTVGAALVSEETAASGKNITFIGDKNQFWGFRVAHEGEQINEKYDRYDIPCRSLSQIQEMTRSKQIDILKLDVEGEEKQIFNDRESWPTLCGIICIASEVHWWVQGAQEAFDLFLSEGCQDDPFKLVIGTGEYKLYCRSSQRLPDPPAPPSPEDSTVSGDAVPDVPGEESAENLEQSYLTQEKLRLAF